MDKKEFLKPTGYKVSLFLILIILIFTILVIAHFPFDKFEEGFPFRFKEEICVAGMPLPTGEIPFHCFPPSYNFPLLTLNIIIYLISLLILYIVCCSVVICSQKRKKK